MCGSQNETQLWAQCLARRAVGDSARPFICPSVCQSKEGGKWPVAQPQKVAAGCQSRAKDIIDWTAKMGLYLGSRSCRVQACQTVPCQVPSRARPCRGEGCNW